MKLLIAIATLLAIGCKDDPYDAVDHVLPASSAPPAKAPAAKFTNSARSELGRTRADAAMHAVFARCARSMTFDGANVEGDYNEPWEGHRENANVKIDLADPAIASGNTLWYFVNFDGGGVPVTITATKDVAARLCALPAKDVAVAL